MKQFTLSAAFMLAAPGLIACPLCNSETGQNVRATIMDPDFFTNLLLMILPSFIFAAVALAIQYGLPFRKRAAVTSDLHGRSEWKQTEGR